MRLSGRRVFLPNPLLPIRPQFLVRWSIEWHRSEAPESLAPLQQALFPIGVITSCSCCCCSPWRQCPGHWVPASCCAPSLLFYMLTLTALVFAWRRRVVCRIPGRTFWLLALDALACAPFAVNLVRKITLRHGIAGDPLRFAAGHMDPAARDTIRQLMAERMHRTCRCRCRRARTSHHLLNSRME